MYLGAVEAEVEIRLLSQGGPLRRVVHVGVDEAVEEGLVVERVVGVGRGRVEAPRLEVVGQAAQDLGEVEVVEVLVVATPVRRRR